MRNPVKRSEGYGVLRAFGAVAALAVLYGFSLSATALMDPLPEASTKPVAWYAPVEQATAQRTEATNVPVRGRSFWTPPDTSSEALPASATVGATAVASFWRTRDTTFVVPSAQLAGDLDRKSENL